MSVERTLILNSIFSYFQSAGQYVASNPSGYAEYFNSAEALIKVLEVQDCGSVGGFDKDNKVQKITECKVYNRFLTLVRKHNDEKNIKPICDFTIETLGDFYNKLALLRSSI